jgi:hypothetical protein
MAEAQQDTARAEPVGYLLTTASGEDQVVRRIRFSEAVQRLDVSRAATAAGDAAGLSAAGRERHPCGDCHPVGPEADGRILRDVGAVN